MPCRRDDRGNCRRSRQHQAAAQRHESNCWIACADRVGSSIAIRLGECWDPLPAFYIDGSRAEPDADCDAPSHTAANANSGADPNPYAKSNAYADPNPNAEPNAYSVSNPNP